MLLGVGLCASAQDKKLEFDVASIRISAGERPPVTGTRHECPTPTSCLAEMKEMEKGSPPFGGPGSSDPGRMTFRRSAIDALIMVAFAVQREQLSAPDSIRDWL